MPDLVKMEKLHTISLRQNTIRNLYDIHPHLMEVVQHLDLASNQIGSVEAVDLQDSTVLKTLDLSYNNVSIIQDCAFCNTAIQTLNLGFNWMRSINPQMVDYVRF